MNRKATLLLAVTLMLTLTACGGKDGQIQPTPDVSGSLAAGAQTGDPEENPEAARLYARFGAAEAYVLYLEDNQTAKDIATHVGTSAWNLPIYHYEGFEGSDVMQYYDIPSRYEITDLSETVTEEKTGEVYYSEPNRIILFYGDAAIEGEYTLVGHFEATEDFVKAVVENPVVPGWGNKIISISAAE